MPEVEVWQAAIDDEGSWTSIALDPTDQARADRFGTPARRLSFIRGRQLLRHLLSSRLGRPTDEVQIDVDGNGRPSVRLEGNDSPVEISLSHSGNIVLVAIGVNNRVGVDVERIDPDIDYPLIVKRFFDPGEAAAVESVPVGEEQRREFFRCWTRKEATLKAAGVEGDDSTWEVHDISPADGYVAAVAVHHPATIVRLLRVR